MKKTLLIASVLMLILNLKSSGQNSYIKGGIVDYETDFALTGVAIVPDSTQNAVLSDMNGNFEIIGSSKNIELHLFPYYTIKIMNIPIENKQIDFGDIKLVANHRYDSIVIGGHSINSINEDDIENDKKLKEEVLKKYRIKVSGKKLKPHFEGKVLVFDFDRNGKKK